MKLVITITTEITDKEHAESLCESIFLALPAGLNADTSAYTIDRFEKPTTLPADPG